jgi:hypothetical protein
LEGLFDSHWKPLTLDMDVLNALHNWNKKEKGKHLPVVLQQVTSAIESRGIRFALELIPNDPFPVGSLVKGMVGFAVVGMVCQLRRCSSRY